jgi:hypothetical protein
VYSHRRRHYNSVPSKVFPIRVAHTTRALVGFSFNGQSKKKKEIFFTIQFVESSLSLVVQMNDKSFFPFLLVFLFSYFPFVDDRSRLARSLRTSNPFGGEKIRPAFTE